MRDRRDFGDRGGMGGLLNARSLVDGPNHAHIRCMDVLKFTGTRADPLEIIPCRLHD